MGDQPKTAQEFTSSLPLLTDNALPIKPPFLFNGMSARVFPLRAQLDTLQRVCDGLVNFIPPQAGYFRAPMPYVFMMVLDYGQVAEAIARIGWFAQIEVFFMIPVEWYKFVGGQWVFHDWAVLTPYVFVDDSFSVPLGRTVYGFPKVLATVEQNPSAWINDPNSPITLATIATDVFPQAYAGKNMQSCTFLEIERVAASGLQIPFDPTAATLPWSMATNLAKAAAGFSRDATALAQSMRISSVNPTDPGVLQSMLAKMMPWFAPGGKGFVQNSINLKQFRRSNEPTEICYQALTNGCMETTAFNGGGLLGEYGTMLGDLSGGHSIKLYDFPSLPIVRTLGLEVNRQWAGPLCNVNELKPVVPFWINVDIKYDAGFNLAWRINDGIWKDPAGVPFDPQPPASQAEAPMFNSTVTTAIDEIAGPFEFPDTTVRVMPLLAERGKLKKYIDGYINKPLESPMKDAKGKNEEIRFKVWSRRPPVDLPGDNVDDDKVGTGEDLAYVYLMATSFGSVVSDSNNVGNWTKYQLSFMIPVEFQRKGKDGNWNIAGIGLIPAFSFVDNCIAAIARFEVQGFQATVANITCPNSVWMSDQVDATTDPQQSLLRLDTEVWSAFGQAQKATIQPIIEISQGDPNAGLGTGPDSAWRWSESLRAELLEKKDLKANVPNALKIGRALALEILGNQMPVTAYSLKQFRDVSDPDKACYQSLVRVPRQITELYDLAEIEDTLVVQIHDYPSLNIVDTLGLVATRLPASSSGIISTVQPVRPFYIRAALHEPLAQRLTWRDTGNEWHIDSEVAFSTLLSEEKGAPRITADFEAEKLQDEMDPCRMSAIMLQASQRLSMTPDEREEKKLKDFSKAEARGALGQIDAQTVIESVLSREWGNIDPNAKWRAGRRTLVTAFSALPVSGKTTAFAESVLFRQVNNELAAFPGAVASPLQDINKFVKDIPAAIKRLIEKNPANTAQRWREQIEAIILAQEEFTRLRLQMDTCVKALAAGIILDLPDFQRTYADLGKKAPTDIQLAAVGHSLLHVLTVISEFPIQGEPSATNNLDASVRANQARLQTLIKEFDLKPLPEPTVRQTREWMTWAKQKSEQFRHMVELARTLCDAQKEAFLNKISRAYQKPDFCIRRDSVGSRANELLPLSLSWDENWYYGRNVEYRVPSLATLKPPSNSGGSKPRRAVSRAKKKV
jgi:hypothetical protein